MFKLPDVMYSWAKPSSGPTETASGLFIPNDDRPALIHFSRLIGGDKIERSWLWLSDNPTELVSLRLAQNYVNSPEFSSIRNSLPKDDRTAYLQVVERDHIKNLPLTDLGIHEVWFGFDYRHYAANRDLPAACKAVMSAKDFNAIAAR